MATQRGIGTDLADHAKSWNVEKKDLKTLLNDRLKVDAGVITVPHGTGSPNGLDTAWSATVTFRTPTPFTDADSVRVFSPDFFTGAIGSGGSHAELSSNVIYDITTAGFKYKAKSGWHEANRRVTWFAVEGWDWW